jgi:hypothetical protein
VAQTSSWAIIAELPGNSKDCKTKEGDENGKKKAEPFLTLPSPSITA